MSHKNNGQKLLKMKEYKGAKLLPSDTTASQKGYE